MSVSYEQRQAKRTKMNWPVSVWHPQASRFYHARSVDVSSNGVLLSMPMKAPIREGQDLEINFPRKELLAREKGNYARIKPARVVRIDRTDAVNTAQVKVGLQFTNGEEKMV